MLFLDCQNCCRRKLRETFSACFGFGVDRETLAQGLLLMRGMPLTTISGEQGHASATRMHRPHKKMGMHMLVARAFFHMGRAMFSDPPLTRSEEKLMATIRKLERTSPNQIGDQQMFVKEYFN